MLQTLVTLTFVDYATGLLAGAYEGKLSSKIGYKGIIKKVMMFAIVVLATCMDRGLNTELIRNITVVFYIGNESLSIIENVIRADVKIPSKLKQALKELLEKMNNKEGEN